MCRTYYFICCMWKLLLCNELYIYLYTHIVVVVSFNQSAYSVDEDDGLALPVLVVNGSSAVNFTVQVMTTDGSATGNDHVVDVLHTYTKYLHIVPVF